MSYYFGEQTWVELEEYNKKDALILLPVGILEEHGRHLPVQTDARIAEEVARAIAEDLSGEIPLLVMPAVWSGYTPKTVRQWPGSIVLRPRVFMEMIHDVCASLIEMGFKKILMLDCHGQHGPMLNVVTKEIADEYGVYMAVTKPMDFSAAEFNKIRKSERGGVLHACEWETSVMLLYTDLVNMDEATAEDRMRYHSDFVAGDSTLGGQKVVWSTWGLQDSQTGVYGDPTAASRETGEVIMRAMLENYRAFIREFYYFTK